MPTKLGQNFLKDQSVVKRIIESARLSADDVVLEVGPGRGILTADLAKIAKQAVAVELDHSLIAPLEERFANKHNVTIVEGDILKINLPELVTGHLSSVIGYKLVANIPYYITAKIIRLFLETKYPPKEMILMVQKEVAERICAPAGKMSLLAVSVQYYAEPEILFTVPKTAFDPVPEVDSAVIRIRNYDSGFKNKEEAARFFQIVRAGFSARRKTLANNLANGLHLPKETAFGKIKSAGLSEKVRAQDLSVADWKTLSSLFEK